MLALKATARHGGPLRGLGGALALAAAALLPAASRATREAVVVPDNGMFCLEGPAAHLAELLRGYRASPVARLWAAAQVLGSDCASRGYAAPLPEGRACTRGLPVAAFVDEDRLHGSLRVSAPRRAIEAYAAEHGQAVEGVYEEMARFCGDGDGAGTINSTARASAPPSVDPLKTMLFSKRMLEAPSMEEHGNKTGAPQAPLWHPDVSKLVSRKQQKEMHEQIIKKKVLDAMQNPLVRQAVSRAAQQAPKVLAQAAQAWGAAVKPALELAAGKAKKALSQVEEDVVRHAMVDVLPNVGLKKPFPGTWSYSGVQEDGTFKYVSVGTSKTGVLSKTTFKTRPENQGWDGESVHLKPGAVEVDTKTEGTIPWGPGKEHKEGHVSSQTRVRLPHKPTLFVSDELHTARKDLGWNRLEGRNVVMAGRTVAAQDLELWTNKNGAFKSELNGKFESPDLEEPVRWKAEVGKPALTPLASLRKQPMAGKAARTEALEPVVKGAKAAKGRALRGA